MAATQVTMVPFDPSQLGTASIPISATNARRIRATEVLQISGDIQVAIDGPMYSSCSPEPCGSPDYFLLDRARGIAITGRYPTRGATISVIPGQPAVAMLGNHFAETATIAVQGYPTLVWEGRNDASAAVNTSSVWRAALGIMVDGRLFVAVGHGTMREFAEALRLRGAKFAVYLDGGGSTSLVSRGGTRIGHPENRPVAEWITVRGSTSHPVRAVASTGGGGRGITAGHAISLGTGRIGLWAMGRA